MRRAALTLLPLFTLLLAGCATPGHRPHAAAGRDCPMAAAPAGAASGPMAMPMHDAMHAQMHARMHGGAARGEHDHAQPQAQAQQHQHQHAHAGAAAPGGCPQARP